MLRSFSILGKGVEAYELEAFLVDEEWVNDGVICKFVLKTEVDDYLDKGWKLGNGNCRSNK